jgi:hypothetical protein
VALPQLEMNPPSVTTMLGAWGLKLVLGQSWAAGWVVRKGKEGAASRAGLDFDDFYPCNKILRHTTSQKKICSSMNASNNITYLNNF